MNKELINRTAMISNNIIPMLLSEYEVEQIRIFFTCVSKMQTKWETLKKVTIDYEPMAGYYDGIEYVDKTGTYNIEEEEYEVELSINELRDYAFRMNHTKSEMIKIFKALSIKLEYKKDSKYITLSPIDRIEFNEDTNRIKVKFNRDNFQYIVGVLNNFTVVELLEAKRFKSKYQIGVYMKYKQYSDKGIAYLGVNSAREYFSCSLETRLLVDKIKKAVEVVNKEIGSDIKVIQDKDKHGATINIYLKFAKRMCRS